MVCALTASVWAYVARQNNFARQCAERVERALRGVDNDQTAKDIRAYVTSKSGEIDSVQEVHGYPHAMPRYAYVMVTVVAKGKPFASVILIKNGRFLVHGAIQHERVGPVSP
ncbi:MAG TPA: hypothetical protein VNI20_12825 [Fimbriimonadaceae bacterium]|nr:hypothetical protein [Fimbriimonadaceae bacterium]